MIDGLAKFWLVSFGLSVKQFSSSRTPLMNARFRDPIYARFFGVNGQISV